MAGQRNLAIDRFRGMTIVLMVIVNDLAGVEGIPWILKHAPQAHGITIADLVSKFFIFAIAATYAMSFDKRAAASRSDAYFHFVSRYLAIMGIGALFGTFEAAWEGSPVWGTLQTIGLSGLLTLPLIRRHAAVRAAAGGLVLAAYQLAFQYFPEIFTGELGALLEALPMAAALMLSTAMIDVYRKGLKPFLLCTGLLALAAFGPLLLPWVEITKRNQVTFILICVSIACAIWLAVDLLSKKIRPERPGLLCWWGENPMLLYVLHLMFIGTARVLDPRPLWLAIPVNLAMLSMLSLIAWGLHRKKLRVSF